jgi:hypothetical protein
VRRKRAAEEADRGSSSETNALYRLALTKKAKGRYNCQTKNQRARLYLQSQRDTYYEKKNEE